jgi:hypothetical protein
MKLALLIGFLTTLSLNAFTQTQNIPPIPPIEISIDTARIDILEGNISETGQQINYTFIPPRDGRYRFEMAELRDNARVSIRIFNRLGENIANDDCGNGQGVSRNLDGDQPYRIEIRQYSGISPYNLIIGHQKETVDISRLTGLSDSIQYID